MNVTDSLSQEKCTGCGLCSVICPKKCISMIENSEGFLYPNVDEGQCVDCQACVKKCPLLNDTKENKHDTKYYSAISKNEKQLKESSSGGVFGILAEYVLAQGGAVCGCVYNDKLEAIHIVTEDKREIEKMYGSKYVQSRVFDCFEPIKNRLETGQVVLFTGTACQVAALKSYLGVDYDNLYTVDILCHGVPSPGLFRLFVNHYSKKYNRQVVDVRFRDKEKHGWGSEHRTSITFVDGKKIWPFMPAYFSAFFYGLSLRESCYRCKYAGTNRVSDLTIGDYWGSWKKYGKRFVEGISVVSINSRKGQGLFDYIQECLVFVDRLMQDEALWSNDNFHHPVSRPTERNWFYCDMNSNNKLIKSTYLNGTYRKKTIVSIYGAIIPENIRLHIHQLIERRPFR